MLFTKKYSVQISGVLHCYDRIIIQGTIPKICYADGMTSYLHMKRIRLFDYPSFATPFRKEIRNNAEKIIENIIIERGNHPGLVHNISAMEACPSYKPWHNKKAGKTYLKSIQEKGLHYYFYFIDEDLGLCYVRVPTWCPFRLQIYFNGHNVLNSAMKKESIQSIIRDNAFLKID